MDDKTLVERLRMTGKRISVPCPDGIDGCLVNHFRIETDPLCDEAATRIEALEAALRDAAKAERDRLRELPEQISVLVSDRAILLLDISETDGRLSRLCDEIRQALADALESQP